MHNFRLVAVAALLMAAPAAAQVATPPAPADPVSEAVNTAVRRLAAEAGITDPVKTVPVPLLRLLAGLEVEPKIFQADSAGEQTATGFSYTYQHDLRRVNLQQAGTARTMASLNLSSEGNVVLQGEYRPNDFLEGDLSFALSRTTGGLADQTAGVTDRLTDGQKQQIIQATDQLAQVETEAELRAVEGPIFDLITSQLTTQVYWELALDAGVETDQAFTREQFVYGAHFGVSVTAWNPGSAIAQMNLFDYPFAAIRWLSDSDVAFAPRGYAIPSLLVGLAMVDPTGDDPRARAGETSAYPRAMIESAFKTPVFRQGDGWLHLEADFRHYRELGASDVVKAAHADHYTWFAATLISAEGLFASYTTGRLPLDARGDDTFGLGFRWKF